MQHWDLTVRTTGAAGLALLTQAHPEACCRYVPALLLPRVENSNLPTRHGALLAIAAILGQIPHSQIQTYVDAATLAAIKDLGARFLPKESAHHLVKSFGGELTLIGLSEVASALGQAGYFPAHQRDAPPMAMLAHWVDLMEWTFVLSTPPLHVASTTALRTLLHASVLNPLPDIADRVQRYMARTMDASLSNDSRAAFATALAQVPLSNALALHLWDQHDAQVSGDAPTTILGTLLRGVSPLMEGAEGRVASVRALQSLVLDAGSTLANDQDVFAEAFPKTVQHAILQALFGAMADYTTDARGDVGSWVRLAAMQCLVDLCQSSAFVVIQTPEAERVVACLLKQCCERIDKVRAMGCHCLKQLFSSYNVKQGESAVAGQKELLALCASQKSLFSFET